MEWLGQGGAAGCLENTGVDQDLEVSLLSVSLLRALELCESPGEGLLCGIPQAAGP